jgi:uncharacterized protein (TIGR03437 family)
MNRLSLLVFLSLGGLCLDAQSSGTVSISTVPNGARFSVDGQVYNQAITLVWPAGSKHLLAFLVDPSLPGQPANASVQTSADGAIKYAFTGWVDNAALLVPTGDPIQTITADPRITSLKATLAPSYRVLLSFFNSQDPADTGLAPNCGAPGVIPSGQVRPGVVFVGSQCYWSSAAVFVPAGSALSINAFPYPGFVFVGWSMNSGAVNPYLSKITVNGPMTLGPQFSPGKRIHFLTAPLGLKVLIDHSEIPTRSINDLSAVCPTNESQPVAPLSGFPALCFGDFDFAPGSTHVIAGVSPQLDLFGKWWVFDVWSNGAAANSAYTVDSNTANADLLTAKFVPGAQVSLLTNPTGLKLSVDGRQNWASYNFIWGMNSVHQVSAPANQFDAKGRQYTFQAWSNGSGAAQTLNVDQSAVDNGLRVTASYSALNRVVVQSSPPGLTLQVDGTSCQTPCNIDRTSGTQLRITAPAQVPMGEGTRLDFTSWSDGGASDHTLAVNQDSTTITANYTNSYRLATASDPANGVSFQFTPSSSDGFFPQNTQVTVSASPNAGFKFRRWGGDLAGTFPTMPLMMSGPRAVVAQMDTVPYIAPAGVRNAAGDTPSSAVAPGSIITIFGENLSPTLEVGRVNPLSQAIAGVTVTVDDRILGLLFVSPKQINAQVPSNLPDGDYTLAVHSTTQADVSATFTVRRDAPGLFFQSADSQQYAIALHEDGSLVTPENPAKAGETLALLGTGFGPYKGIVIDGFFPPEPAPVLMDSVTVSAGDQSPVQASAGAALGYTGVAATKFRVPDGLPAGANVALKVTVNGTDSNTVTLPIQ